MSNIKVLYHGDCPDGSLAAYTAYRKLGKNAKYIACTYYNNFVDKIDKGDTVYLLDFHVDRRLLLDWYDRAESILVLDHHATAERTIGDLDFVTVDKNECGATLAFKHFFPGREMPLMYNYVRDRDLWLWEKPNSKEINSFINFHSTMVDDFSVWDYIYTRLNVDFANALREGKLLNDQRRIMVQRMIKYAAPLEVGQHTVPSVNSSVLMSEIGNALLSEYPDAPFSCVYVVQNGRLRCSLRSEEGRKDVSTIAESYGGGGHRNSSGMTFTPHSWEQIGVPYEN